MQHLHDKLIGNEELMVFHRLLSLDLEPVDIEPSGVVVCAVVAGAEEPFSTFSWQPVFNTRLTALVHYVNTIHEVIIA